MNSHLLVNPFIALLILILIVAGAYARASRRVTVARPDHHHWVARLLCIVLVAAALVAVGVGTWHGTDAEFNSPPVTVLVPAHTPPASDPTGNERDPVIGPAKFILTVVLASSQHDRLLPLGGDSISIEWPAKFTADPVFHGTHGGTAYTVTFNQRQFDDFCRGRDPHARLSYSRTERGGSWSTSGGGSLTLDHLTTDTLGGRSVEHAPLSLIPTGEGRELRLLLHLARAEPDDPLEKIPAAQWLAGQARKLPQPEAAPFNSYPGVRYDRNVPPGVRMLAFLGPAGFLLLIAAIAGCAVFRRCRRAFAFAGLLALMVLYAGGLDAMVLQRRVGLTKSAGQPESVRAVALGSLLHGTYFHREAAISQLRELATDPSIPESLQQGARTTLKEGQPPNRPGP